MIIVPIYILIILLFGVIKKVNCFDTFLDGAGVGIKNAFNLFPTIIGIVFAVNVFTGSGIIEILSRIINHPTIVPEIFIQALLFVSTSSIPLPGAVGISESAFLKIYITVFGIERVASAMLLSRGVSFYLFMIISLFVVIYNTIKRKRSPYWTSSENRNERRNFHDRSKGTI